MKTSLLLLCLLAGFSLNLSAQCPVKAKHFRKKLQLATGELYYVSKADMAARYASTEKRLAFPNNHVYDHNGTELLALRTNGDHYPFFPCFQAMCRDLDSFVAQAPNHIAITDTGSMSWAQEYMHPAYEGAPKRALSKYNIVMYYPAGMPLMGKYYKSFMKQLHYYQKQGEDLSLYVVLVPIMKK